MNTNLARGVLVLTLCGLSYAAYAVPERKAKEQPPPCPIGVYNASHHLGRQYRVIVYHDRVEIVADWMTEDGTLRFRGRWEVKGRSWVEKYDDMPTVCQSWTWDETKKAPLTWHGRDKWLMVQVSTSDF